MALLTALAVLAVVLAAIGLYDVIAYGVAQRTRENVRPAYQLDSVMAHLDSAEESAGLRTAFRDHSAQLVLLVTRPFARDVRGEPSFSAVVRRA